MAKEKTNEKNLYICESQINSFEYKEIVKYFPQVYWLYYWLYVISGLIVNLVLSLIIALVFKRALVGIIFFAIYQVYLMIKFKVRLEYYIEKSFNAKQKKKDTNLYLEFYKEYFTVKARDNTSKINYYDIEKAIETDTNFYLKSSHKKIIIPIKKSDCEIELIDFIRNTFKCLENHLGENTNFKGVKICHNPKIIKNGMIILFILTILSLWLGLYSLALLNKLMPKHGLNFLQNTWVFWCWLPIPILSVVLGFKYRRAGFKCTKNIVVGFIVGFLLLIYGAFWLFPTFSQDYSKIDEYREVIDAELPNDGELEILDLKINLDDKKDYMIINVYYDKEDVSNLEASIENNDNWIRSNEIKSELKIFFPSQMSLSENAYLSIYNNTTKEYNTLPSESGTYEIYVIKYEKSDKHLEIHKFNYIYK